jgi:hypothetical protein
MWARLSAEGVALPRLSVQDSDDLFAYLLVQQMWSHQAIMEKAVTKKQRGWVELTGQDLTDVSMYLRNLPQNNKAPAEFSLPEPASGEASFQATLPLCHKDSTPLDKRLGNHDV